MAQNLTLNVNGVSRTVTVSDTNMPLLWVLRDILGLTGMPDGPICVQRDGGRFLPLASEAAHIEFAPATDEDAAVIHLDRSASSIRPHGSVR